MVGINTIGSKVLTTGTKGLPSFGSSATPSFGNSVEYHDEFVRSHDDDGLTAKKVGLFAIIGLAVGGAVALMLRNPKAAEHVEQNIMEVELKENGILRSIGGAAVGAIKSVGRGIACGGKAVGGAVAWTAKGGVNIIGFPFKKAGQGIGYFGKDARHARKLKNMAHEAEKKDLASKLGLGAKGKAPATPSPLGILGDLNNGTESPLKQARRLRAEATAKAKDAEIPGKFRRALRWANPLNHVGKGAERLEAARVQEAALRTKKAAVRAGGLEGLGPEIKLGDGTPPTPPVATTPPAARVAGEVATELSELDKQGFEFLNAVDKPVEQAMYHGGRKFEEVWQEELPARLANLNEKIDGELKQAVECGNGWVAGQYISEENISYAQARAKAMGYLVETIKPGSYKLKKA